MTIEVARRYEQISPKSYEHPADKAATSALHSVPLLDTVVKRLTDLGHERRLRQIVMGNAIRLGPKQVPDAWAAYVRCAGILDIAEVPDLYLINSPDINAMTIGAKTPIVIINSSMIRSFDTKEVETVLAHEVAHVLSEHYYYTTALVLLSQFLQGALPRSLLLGLPVRAMYLALLEWARAAELTADRAAALVMADPLQPCRVLMQLAGGSVPGMNFDVFLEQANDYESEDDLFSRHARLLVRAQPHASRRGAPGQGAHGVGPHRRVRPHLRRRLRAAGPGAAALGGIRGRRGALPGALLPDLGPGGRRRPRARPPSWELARALPEHRGRRRRRRPRR